MSDIRLTKPHVRSYRPDLPLRSELGTAALLKPTAEDLAYYAAHPLQLRPTLPLESYSDIAPRPFGTSPRRYMSSAVIGSDAKLERIRSKFATFNIVEHETESAALAETAV